MATRQPSTRRLLLLGSHTLQLERRLHIDPRKKPTSCFYPKDRLLLQKCFWVLQNPIVFSSYRYRNISSVDSATYRSVSSSFSLGSRRALYILLENQFRNYAFNALCFIFAYAIFLSNMTPRYFFFEKLKSYSPHLWRRRLFSFPLFVSNIIMHFFDALFLCLHSFILLRAFVAYVDG